MKYISVCSGIEAATVAWEPLGWEPLWFAEVEPFCCSLLKHHYPDVPNLGDITKITEEDLGRFSTADVLVGGTPCQSFSVAGLRGGLDDPRGNLALRFCQLAGYLWPRWVLWENVPGVHTSWTDREAFAPSEESCQAIREAGLDPGDFEEVDQTSDFDSFLAAFSELGYECVYRSLDAQYFNLAQRRNRVFALFHLGDWTGPAAVLLERESLCGHPPPSREAGAGVAGSVTQRIDRGGVNSEGHDEHLVVPILEAGARQGTRDDPRDGIGVGEPGDPMFTLQSGKQHAIAFDCKQSGEGGEVSPPLRALNHDKSHANAGGQVACCIPLDMRQASRGEKMTNNRPGGSSGGAPGTGVGEDGDASPTIAESHPPAVAFAQNTRDEVREIGGNIAGALSAQPGMKQQTYLQQAMAVRRLTPRECERLMGFPDDFTKIPYRNKPVEQCPDGPRYKALGNSIAVPVMRWLGARIESVGAEVAPS